MIKQKKEINNQKINEEKEIEDFIEWLRHFFSANVKQKNKIIKKIRRESKEFADWLESVRDFTLEEQQKLIDELRYSEW